MEVRVSQTGEVWICKSSWNLLVGRDIASELEAVPALSEI